jgi:hypothetical protein
MGLDGLPLGTERSKDVLEAGGLRLHARLAPGGGG